MKPSILAYASKSSGDQATRSRKSGFGRHLSWREIVAVIIISSLMFYLGSRYPRALAGIMYVLIAVSLVGAAALLFFVCRSLVRIWRHPANRIAKLLNKGRTQEACAMGRNLLLKHPDDPMLRINVAAALYLAANLDDARQVFDAIDAKAVPPQLQAFYEDWRQRFHSGNDA